MNLQKERKPSEIIQDFIDLLKDSQSQYDDAKKKLEELDSHDRNIYWAHKFEFAKDKAERNRLATAYQTERKRRRRYKDIADLHKAVSDFASAENNKIVLKRLNGMLNIQKAHEQYLESDRHYKAGDTDDTSGR